jgi:hypothetical protein
MINDEIDTYNVFPSHSLPACSDMSQRCRNAEKYEAHLQMDIFEPYKVIWKSEPI